MNFFVYVSSIFLTLLCTQASYAITVDELVPEIQITVQAEVVSPCGFNLSDNFVEFSLKPSDSDNTLIGKAKPITFSVNCPFASRYYYTFLTSAMSTNMMTLKKCAQAFNGNGDSKDYILFCIKDQKGNYYNVATSAAPGDGQYFQGEIPKGSEETDVITDTLYFYPWWKDRTGSASGKYTGILTVIFYVD